MSRAGPPSESAKPKLDVSGLRQTWPLPSQPRPIVIVGAGGIVRDAHMPAYRKAGLTVTGVTDVESERAGSLAVDYGLRNLYPELDQDPFIRLDPYDEFIFLASHIRVPEKLVVRRFKMDHHFGYLGRHPFGRPHIEGNICPAPVIDIEFKCGIRFGGAPGVYPGFLTVSGDSISSDITGKILCENRLF